MDGREKEVKLEILVQRALDVAFSGFAVLASDYEKDPDSWEIRTLPQFYEVEARAALNLALIEAGHAMSESELEVRYGAFANATAVALRRQEGYGDGSLAFARGRAEGQRLVERFGETSNLDCKLRDAFCGGAIAAIRRFCEFAPSAQFTAGFAAGVESITHPFHDDGLKALRDMFDGVAEQMGLFDAD